MLVVAKEREILHSIAVAPGSGLFGSCLQLIAYSTWKMGGEAVRGMASVIVAAHAD
jgi:hypothetical protein